ncbi:MAG TPA: dTDP-4-dehydrorhamnose 3,5-epimerase family protein [Thermomicrobiales bacterium]|nr:dTDP-4-dehydrorhamnose 3,5-epimerase family protein [Thermomicrobiales bacterium]
MSEPITDFSQFAATTLDAVEAVLVTAPGSPSTIDGVIVHGLKTNRDPRGTLTELLRSDWPDIFGETMPFAQVYTSTTAPGVARDIDKWHVHQHQTDRFYCVAGRIVVAIADPRPESPTRGKVMLVELAAQADAPAPMVVTIPPQTLHGFVVTSPGPATLLNFPNRLYDPVDEGRLPFEEAGVTFADGAGFSYDAVRAWYDKNQG